MIQTCIKMFNSIPMSFWQKPYVPAAHPDDEVRHNLIRINTGIIREIVIENDGVKVFSSIKTETNLNSIQEETTFRQNLIPLAELKPSSVVEDYYNDSQEKHTKKLDEYNIQFEIHENLEFLKNVTYASGLVITFIVSVAEIIASSFSFVIFMYPIIPAVLGVFVTLFCIISSILTIKINRQKNYCEQLKKELDSIFKFIKKVDKITGACSLLEKEIKSENAILTIPELNQKIYVRIQCQVKRIQNENIEQKRKSMSAIVIEHKDFIKFKIREEIKKEIAANKVAKESCNN